MMEAALIRKFKIVCDMKGGDNVKKAGDHILGQPPV
jgi:hypothetical protein